MKYVFLVTQKEESERMDGDLSDTSALNHEFSCFKLMLVFTQPTMEGTSDKPKKCSESV